MPEAKITREALQRLGYEQVPFTEQIGLVVDSVAPGEVVVRVRWRDQFSRPGGTLAGPIMMGAADFAMYGVVLSLIGPVALAVTTNLNINFLRRPPPADLVARGTILKLGRRLAVGEVSMFAGDDEDLVAHVTCTYSIPPAG